jgi:type IV secretory pathway TraG/TraD family ATPase VirD4
MFTKRELSLPYCDYMDIPCTSHFGLAEFSLLHYLGAGFLFFAIVVVLFLYYGKEFISGRFQAARPKRSKGNELGSSDLASKEQIKKWVRDPKKLDTVLYVSGMRASDGAIVAGNRMSIPNEERNRHVLIIAKTGGGKTTKAILPVLYNDCLCPERSTIVIDSKPEMWGKLAGMTRKYNPRKNLMLFNPLDPTRSMSWNILSKVTDDTDAKLIANTIIMATDVANSKQDSPFFRNNALQLLNAMMVGLLNDPNDTLSMPRVHELLHSGKNALCDWLEHHPHAIRNARTFVELARSGSQNADTVLSELGMRLSAWDLPAIRATTALEELDLEMLITEPTLMVIELRESEIEMLRPMANTVVVEILRFLTKRAESFPGAKLPRPVGLVIDEFASALGRLPDIHVKLNTLRSRNVSIVAAIQSIGQIKANYNTDADSVIAGFSSKILMPMLDFQDSEWASKETGTMTIRFKTMSAGTNRKIIENFASRNKGTQEQVQQRAVLTPDEIGRPPDNINTFFMPNTPVFQGFLTPYYEVPELRTRIDQNQSYEKELKVRTAPIAYEENLAAVGGAPAGSSGASSAEIKELLEQAKKKLDWENTTGVAREWWEAFEAQNQENLATVLMLTLELLSRQATITEFFLAYVYSDVDSVEENLKYLDQMREQRKMEEAELAGVPVQAAAAGAGDTE